MVLDVFTITFIGSIVQISLTILIFLQYKVNKHYQGIGLWFTGSVLLSFSFIFMFLYSSDSFWKFSILGNPFVILGHLFFYLGITRFFETKAKKYLLFFYTGISIITYLCYIFFVNDTVIRALVVGSYLAIISLLTSCKLFHRKNKIILTTAKFLGYLFLFYGVFQLIKIAILITNPIICFP